MSKKYIMFNDANDVKVFVPITEVNRVLREESLTLFGMSLDEIAGVAKRKGKSEEIEVEYEGKIYAIGSILKSKGVYTDGPTKDLKYLLSSVGNGGDVIYDITSPLEKISLYHWSLNHNDWKKYTEESEFGGPDFDYQK